MNFKDLIEEFYAYCNEKSTTPTREVLEDLRQIWDCYSSENGDRCIWEACKDFAKTPAPETVQARRYDLSNSIVRITRDMWRIGHNNPMRKYPNPIIPGFEAEELVDYAKALTKNDLSTDEFLMVSMLLSGLKWTEMVAMEWSRVIIDHVSTPAFVIGDRYLTLTSRINPDDFCLILAMA
ncbi:MAG: hypothetical protein FP831_15630, partial [Anaerolineae bacterium]|nr:hypothetical protein [Anaerolineae bacterium]